MENNCIMCLTIETHPENDIGKQQIAEKPVFAVMEELFGSKVDVANRRERELPHKVCPACTQNLTTAYKLTLKFRKALNVAAKWEENHEAGEVFSADIPFHDNDFQEVSMDYPIDVKEESIVGSDSEDSEEVDVKEESVVGTDSEDSEDTELQSRPESGHNALEESHNAETVSQPQQANQVRRKKLLKCEICSKTFLNPHGIKQHLRHAHTTEKPFKCNACPSAFKSASNLKYHQRRHMKENQYCCDNCGCTFSMKPDLYNHMLRHHYKSKLFECNVCHLLFKQNACLWVHKSIHLKDNKKFSCEICNKTFRLKHELKGHLLKAHIDKKSYECTICHKRSKTAYYFKIHQMSHIEKPFECDSCGKLFGSKEKITKHVTIHIQDRPVSCKICYKTFKSQHRVAKHVNSVHSKKFSHVCNICNKSYKYVKSLKIHMEKAHNN